jgi:hypothetical protein
MQIDGKHVVDVQANFAGGGKFDASAMMGQDFMAILRDMSALQSERNLRNSDHDRHHVSFAYYNKDNSLEKNHSMKKNDSLGCEEPRESWNAKAYDEQESCDNENTDDKAYFHGDVLDPRMGVQNVSAREESVKTNIKKAENASLQMAKDFSLNNEEFAQSGAVGQFSDVESNDDTLTQALNRLEGMSSKELKESLAFSQDKSSNFDSYTKEQFSFGKERTFFDKSGNFQNNSQISSMLRELNGTLESSGDVKLMEVAKSLSAKEFANIEKSLMQSLNMQSESLEAKLNTLTQNKIEGREQSLMRSMQVLQDAAKGMNQSLSLSLNPEAMNLAAKGDSLTFLKDNSFSGMRAALRGISAFTAPLVDAHMSQGQQSAFNQQGNAEHNLYSQFRPGSLLNSDLKSSGTDGGFRFDMLTLSQNLKENAEALTKKVMEMASRNLKNVELTLNPEGLGKIKISIDATLADEISKISIGATLSHTRALLENGLASLKEVLNANDINCEPTIEETQGENDSDSGENREESRQGAGQEQPKHNHTVFASDDGTEVREEDNEDNYSVNEEDGSISYFA